MIATVSQIATDFTTDMGHFILGVLLCANLQYLLLGSWLP